jgi:hypothetical protein
MTRSDRRILLVAGVLLLLLVFGFSGSVGMMRGYGPGMMGWYGYQTLGGWAWLAPVGMGLGMLIFWGLLIAVVVLLARSISREGDAPSKAARAVLDQEFAPGGGTCSSGGASQQLSMPPREHCSVNRFRWKRAIEDRTTVIDYDVSEADVS